MIHKTTYYVAGATSMNLYTALAPASLGFDTRLIDENVHNYHHNRNIQVPDAYVSTLGGK